MYILDSCCNCNAYYGLWRFIPGLELVLIQESTCAPLFNINFYPQFYISTSSIDLPFVSFLQSVALHLTIAYGCLANFLHVYFVSCPFNGWSVVCVFSEKKKSQNSLYVQNFINPNIIIQIQHTYKNGALAAGSNSNLCWRNCQLYNTPCNIT
jgi:hypothetical protein